MSIKQALNKFINATGSIVYLFIIIILLVISCIIGSLMPLEIANIHVFNSFWFYGLEFCLCIGIICGCIKQWPFKRKQLGFLLIHLSILIILCGSMMGQLYGKKGYIELVESQSSNLIIKEDSTTLKMPFRIKLNDFILEKHKQTVDQQIAILTKNSEDSSSAKFSNIGKISIPGNDIRLEILQIEPDFVMDENNQATSRSEYWDNPAIKIKINNTEGWLFAKRGYHGMATWRNFFIRYICDVEGGEIKDFKSNLSIIDDDKTVLNKIIEVNKPLVYQGYKFYQHSFDPENLKWTALQVKTDPGVPIVYSGYIVLLVGIFFNIYFMTKAKKEIN